MAAPGDLTILVPVDVSDPDPPPLGILAHLRPIEVILLGYFPVPDQAEPALLKEEYEAEAAARLDALAAGQSDVTEVLVFTHDRAATVDRVADQYGCDAVLSPGTGDALDRILVPIRGDANVERIVAVVADLLAAGNGTATLVHAVAEDADPSQGEFLLRGAADRLGEYGIDADRVDWEVTEGGDPRADIVALAGAYDLVVFGETESSLAERIIGDALSRIIDDIEAPALIVRDVS